MDRPDIDDDVLASYVRSYGEAPPALEPGDSITIPEGPAHDVYVVAGFRAGGMLVDAIRVGGDGQVLTFPRRFQPMDGDSVYLMSIAGSSGVAS